MENVWPEVTRNHSEVTLHIAGRNTPNWLLNLKMNNVVVHGEVPNATDFINRHTVMVVPLFSGSGMRVKILEGMALGKIVISTSLGMEGIQAEHMKDIIVADEAEDFSNMIDFCTKHPKKLQKIGEEAKDFVADFYDNKEIAKELFEIYQGILAKGHHQH